MKCLETARWRTSWWRLLIVVGLPLGCTPTEPSGIVVASVMMSDTLLATGDTIHVTVAIQNATNVTVNIGHPSHPPDCVLQYELVDTEGLAAGPGFTCTADWVASPLLSGRSQLFVHHLSRFAGLRPGQYTVRPLVHVGTQDGQPLPSFEEVTTLLSVQ